MKKQTSLLLLSILFVSIIKSQSWTTSGNSVGAGAALGTTNGQPLNFFTSGQKRASLSISGVFNIGGLAGTGSRFLQVNSSGDLIEWTGNGNANQALFGDNTFKTLPFTFDATKMNVSSGKLGIGIESPAVALDVSGDIKTTGKIMFSSTYGLSYSSTDNVFILGKQTGVGIPSPNSCNNVLPSGYTWLQHDGFRCTQISGNVNGSLGMYLSPVSGNGYIDVSGTDNNGNNNVLYINSNCGRNTNINTGTAGATQMGNLVRMAKHLQIGDSVNGITNAPNNTALDIHVNSGKGIKVKSTSANYSDDMFTIEAPGWFTGVQTRIFNVGADGKTTINNTSGGSALAIYGDLVQATVFDVQYDGKTYFANNVGIGTSPSANSFLKVDAGTNSGNADLFSLASVNAPSALKIDSKGIATFNTDAITTGPIFKIRNQGIDAFEVTYNGVTYTREVVVTLSAFPDYVFAKDYNLLKLKEVKDYVNKNHRLPNMPSAEQVKSEGAPIGEIQRLTVEKVEELYLYIFQLEEKIEKLNDQLTKLQK